MGFRTLFVARINYYTSESKLRREFDQYGTIKSINVVMNQKNNKPRGYALLSMRAKRTCTLLISTRMVRKLMERECWWTLREVARSRDGCQEDWVEVWVARGRVELM